MYKKIELLIIDGISIRRVEYENISFEYQGNFIIIREKKEDNSIIYTPHDLTRVKSFKLSN